MNKTSNLCFSPLLPYGMSAVPTHRLTIQVIQWFVTFSILMLFRYHSSPIYTQSPELLNRLGGLGHKLSSTWKEAISLSLGRTTSKMEHCCLLFMECITLPAVLYGNEIWSSRVYNEGVWERCAEEIAWIPKWNCWENGTVQFSRYFSEKQLLF